MNQPDPHSALGFERIVFFSDAVFAIAITLLVLEIKPPHLEQFSESSLRHHLLLLLPKFSGFVVSFFLIGAMWIEHHRIFRYFRHYDGGVMWRNLVFLLSVAFVPFPTAVFSEYFWSRTAFVLYAASFAGAGLTKLWLWRYAAGRADLLEEGTDEAVLQRISRRSLAVPIGCLVTIPLSLISVFIAPLGFTLIPLIARLLDPTRSKKEKQVIETPAEG
jgi:TMEM175 potassium channel family protein